ncbi:MAG: EVE domain-containing protein [Planctomycetota bacterium]
MVRTWLFKSEPYEFSIDDLKASPRGTSGWEGVRNYQARNLMRDEIGKGDVVIFYHSSVRPPAAVGLAEVVREGYPDRTDGSSPEDPVRWIQVDVRYRTHFEKPVTIDAMREMKGLEELALLRRGNRLSIQPVTPKEAKTIIRAGGLDPARFL